MGLFDKFLSSNGGTTKSSKDDKEKKEKKEKDVIIYIRHPRNQHQLTIYNINTTEENITHAKFKDMETGKVFHISFKNVNSRTAFEMKKENLFLGLIRNGNLDELSEDKNNYLGSISYDENEKERYKIKTPEMEEKEKNKQEKLEFKERIKIEEEKIKEYFDKKEENKKNPFLRVSTLENSEIEGQERIYEGVDLTTGDYIILKNLNGMIVDNKFVYQGYLTYLDTLEEKNTRTKKELESYEVIFELPHEINSFILEGKLNTILQLLSKNEKLLQPYDFNYLGKIERNGKINRELNSSDMIFSYYKKKAENIRMRYEQEQQKEIE